MRLFFSLPLAPNVRAAVAEVQARLQACGADVKWVAPDNFHLTVAFVGDWDEARLPEVEEVGAHLAAHLAPFRFGTRGASSFPRRGPQIKTVFVSVAEGAEAWKVLAQGASDGLAALGVPRAPDLAPHVTLGRVRSSDRGMDDLRAALLADAGTDCGAQAATGIELVQSFLDPRGATYQTLRAWPFEQRDD